MRLAASRTFCTAGSSRPMRTAMMAMTTSNSIRVKPIRRPESGYGDGSMEHLQKRSRVCERRADFDSRRTSAARQARNPSVTGALQSGVGIAQLEPDGDNEQLIFVRQK